MEMLTQEDYASNVLPLPTMPSPLPTMPSHTVTVTTKINL